MCDYGRRDHMSHVNPHDSKAVRPPMTNWQDKLTEAEREILRHCDDCGDFSKPTVSAVEQFACTVARLREMMEAVREWNGEWSGVGSVDWAALDVILDDPDTLKEENDG